MTSHPNLHFFGGAQRTVALPPSRVGLKAAGLMRMAAMGLPVPEGVSLDVELCSSGRIDDAVVAAIRARLGGPVSVRSSGTHSMPGLMDTLLNVGVTTESAGNDPLLLDAYRRLLVGFGAVVFGMRSTARGAPDPLRMVVERACDDGNVETASQLPADRLRKLCDELKTAMRTAGHVFPDEPGEQLKRALHAVLASLRNERMTAWRRDHSDSEPAVGLVVQRMVMGHAAGVSGTGVALSRHPTTGERVLYGEFLRGAQGEDLLGGVRTPSPLGGGRPGQQTLQSVAPELLSSLGDALGKLEREYRDVQEVEFTVENGTLWLLQTRAARRSAKASVRVAVELVEEGLWTTGEALRNVDSSTLNQLMAPMVARDAKRDVLARGVPASVGVATGKVVLHSDDARAMRQRGEPCILVRTETRADDLPGMEAAMGVVTSRGGTTSHAAVVCRGLGKCCVVGCPEIRVDLAQRLFVTKGGRTVRENDVVTVDGHSGEILLGTVELDVQPALAQLPVLMGWADAARKIRVLADASDGDLARKLGADGTGRVTTDMAVVRELRGLRAARASGARAAVEIGTVAAAKSAVELAAEADAVVVDVDALTTSILGGSPGAAVDARVLELVENILRDVAPVPVGLSGSLAADARLLARCRSHVGWVSVPLNRVTGARLAAAQAAVTTENA